MLKASFHFRGRAAQKGPAAAGKRCAPTGMHSLVSVHRFPFCVVLISKDCQLSFAFDALA